MHTSSETTLVHSARPSVDKDEDGKEQDSRLGSLEEACTENQSIVVQGVGLDLEKQSLPVIGPQDVETRKSLNCIDWDGPNDKENPQNWPTWWKWLITATTAIMTFTVTFASSIFSTATAVTAEEFGVSSEVMILGTSLFVLGFAFGPILFGPLSELYGRRLPLFIPFFVFVLFQIPVAVAQNVQTVFICRFFGGFFASAPLAVTGGLMADMFDPIDRAIAIASFSSASFIGPVAGPIVGNFVTTSYLGWRWTAWITFILAFASGVLGLLIVPETLPGKLLQRRAAKIREQTSNQAIHSPLDENEIDVKDIAKEYLLRPIKMLVMEPILLLVTLYMALIYGFLYLCFEAYPIAFQEVRRWSARTSSLPFLAITVGVLLGAATIAVCTKTRFARKLAETGAIIPEERLPPMVLGGFLLPVGMFWFAWTSGAETSWVPQVVAGVCLGCGVLLIFLQGLNYIIDVYADNANSAIAANALFRSALAAGFPMMATGMFHNLGVQWAMSLLGFLSAALFPVPILFFIYGERIRRLSRYSAS